MRCNYPAALEAYRKALALDPKNCERRVQPGHDRSSGRDTPPRRSPRSSVPRTSLPKSFMILGQPRRRLPLGAEPRGKADGRLRALDRPRARAAPPQPGRRGGARRYVATGLAKTGHADEAAEPMRQALAAGARRTRSFFSDAAIVAALAGRDAEALALAAQGRRRRLLPRNHRAPARVRALPRQPGLPLDRRRAAKERPALAEGGHHHGQAHCGRRSFSWSAEPLAAEMAKRPRPGPTATTVSDARGASLPPQPASGSPFPARPIRGRDIDPSIVT